MNIKGSTKDKIDLAIREVGSEINEDSDGDNRDDSCGVKFLVLRRG